MKKAFIALTISLSSLSCVPKLDSIFFDEELVKESSINAGFANLKLQDETRIRLGLITDTHQNYQDLEAVVDILNSRSDLDGVVHLGDFTNEAMALEFKYFTEIILKLNKPFYILPGNHDLIGIGENLYKKIFGPLNHMVSLANFHLVFFNNNSLDSQVDWNWFETALNMKGTRASLVFMHINADNKDYFSAHQSEGIYQVATDTSTAMFLNGHNHVFQSGQRGNLHLVQIARVQERRYGIFEVVRRPDLSFEATIEFCQEGSCYESKNINLTY